MATQCTGVTARVADLVARYYLRKPDQAELLRIKFPDASALAWGALNEGAYLLRNVRSARLTTLNVEVTNRCNLRCTYCPAHLHPQRPRLDLPYELFQDILERAPTVRTLLPFQWGEPLLHPRILDMLRFAAARGVRTFLTTNGTLLDRTMQEGLLSSGLTRLTVSVDGADELHLRRRGVELAPIRERVKELCRLRDQSGSALRVDVSLVLDETTAAGYAEFLRAWRPVVDRVQAIPRLARAPRREACRELWRGLLVVLADGRVTVCCPDQAGELCVGDVRAAAPADIFNGPRMRALRAAHARGRLPPRCAACGEFRHPLVSPRFRRAD
ncbi:MAG: radical SAM protein [Planctomycetes bacterium]|nr:radical SAM protein [Planctomycetota bacterium]